jgi:simple sugar transport system ATP-binding protein
MLELRRIDKYFPENGVQALSRVDFTLSPGEIHALAGENGAGKSTLMHILAGHIAPSAGEILLDGKPVRFSGPGAALDGGIGMVRQHPVLVPGFRVWEACVVGVPLRFPALVRKRLSCRKIRELSEQWGFGLDSSALTDALTVSERQKCAILALIVRKARYLIFDEPTAVLSPGETAAFFALLRRLRSEGRGIVLISHKLEETLAIADRITVLRRGQPAGTYKAAEVDARFLGEVMFGEMGNGLEEGSREWEMGNGLEEGSRKWEMGNGGDRESGIGSRGEEGSREQGAGSRGEEGSREPGIGSRGIEATVCETHGIYPGSPKGSLTEPPFPVPRSPLPCPEPPLPNIPLLSISSLSVEIPGRPFIRGVSLSAGAGEIAGIAGVRDSGLETLEQAVTGFLAPAEGEVTLCGQDITGRGPLAFRQAGGGYLSADRTGAALAMNLPLYDNLIIHSHRRAQRGPFGLLDRRFLAGQVRAIMESAGVNRRPQNPAWSFSGGMLQRLVLAREFDGFEESVESSGFVESDGFAESGRVLVLAEPGWGLDAANRERLHRRLRAFADAGNGVLVFSSDVDELIALADTIRALHNGVLSPPFTPGTPSLRRQVAAAMTGFSVSLSR